MKRKVKERRSFPHRVSDPRKSLPQGQLAALGAVCLAWNDLEAMLDVLLCVVTLVPHVLWRDIATRINGIEGKKGIIEGACVKRFGIRDGWLHDAIFDTLGAASGYRKYRDITIHSRLIDSKNEIGEMAIRRGDIEEVLMSKDALNSLYDHFQALKDELNSLISWFQAMAHFLALGDDDKAVQRIMREQIAARMVAAKEGVPFNGWIAAFPDKQEISQEAQRSFSLYNYYHTARLSLKPLPSFPTESQAPLKREETTGIPSTRSRRRLHRNQEET
jgi:hypothetical protein